MQKPYDINMVVIGADEAATWNWEGKGDGAIMGSWRLLETEFHFDNGANGLERGQVV